MPRTAILAKSISLSMLSGLVDRIVGTAPGRAFGHAAATLLIVGAAADQLGGTDSEPIEEARPKPTDSTGATPPPAVASIGPNEAAAPDAEPAGADPNRSNMASNLLAPSGS